MRSSPADATRMRRLLLPTLLILVCIVFFQVARVFVIVNRLEDDARAMQELSRQGVRAFGGAEQAREVEGLFAKTSRDLADLRSSFGVMVHVLPAFRWLPRYGGDLANASALTEFGALATTSALKTIQVASEIDAAIEAGRVERVPVGVSFLRAAQAQSVAVKEAQQSLAGAMRARQQLDLAALSPSRRAMLERLDRWLPLWQIGLNALESAPALLGADRPRTYLLIAQNSDELRATGGFISGVMSIQVADGLITVGQFRDSFAVDNWSQLHPAPPDPLRKYMYAGVLAFRDANWSPDFPTTARQLQEIYRIDNNVRVDGVIAITLQMVPTLLEATGPMTVEGYDGRVDGVNAVGKIRAYWASPAGQTPSSNWWSHRKDFVGDLMQAMMQRLITGEVDRTRLAGALLDAVISKDLLLYASEADIAPIGKLHTGPGDALMIVDSNVGFNKVDASIERRVSYAVSLENPDAPRARVAITYTNLSPSIEAFCVHQPLYWQSYADLQQGCYWDYVRVVAPAGSRLVQATGLRDASAEEPAEDRAVFGGYFVLERGETRVVTFEYDLPPDVLDQSHYLLHLEKQPGKETVPVSVQVTLPRGHSAIFSPAARSDGNRLELEVSLDRDRELEIRLERDGTPGVVEIALGVMLVFGLGLAGYLCFGSRLKRTQQANAPLARN